MVNLRTSGVFSVGSLGGDRATIPGDDNWNDVTLMLDGSSTTDLSGSSTVTPSASGYTTNNTTGAKFNNSQYIDFQNSGYFNVAFPSALGVSDEPFTVETWAYFDAISNDGVFQLYQSGSSLNATSVQSNASIATAVSSGKFIFYDYGATNTSLGSAATGTWYHIAVVYDGTDLVFYVDGAALKTTTRSMPAGGWTSIGIGGYFSTTYLMDGRIEGFRVTKGVARYTAAFTPPTEAFLTTVTAEALTRPTRKWGGITGQSITTFDVNDANWGDVVLLMKGDNSLSDETGNHTPTATSAAFSTDTPFASGSTHSMSFNGTSSGEITLPYSTDFQFGADQFTVEMWFKWDGTTGVNSLFNTYTGAGYGGAALAVNNGFMGVWVSINGSSWSINNQSGGFSPTANTWHHVALTRQSNNDFELFLDGVKGTTLGNLSTNSVWDNSQPAHIGSNGGFFYYNGLIDEVRITKGVTRYTGDFTVPTEPFLTSAGSTSLKNTGVMTLAEHYQSKL